MDEVEIYVSGRIAEYHFGDKIIPALIAPYKGDTERAFQVYRTLKEACKKMGINSNCLTITKVVYES